MAGATAEVFRKAADLYGDQQAYRLLSNLSEWFELANEVLTPNDPEERLLVDFNKKIDCIEGGYRGSRGVYLSLPGALSEPIFESIPKVAVHEIAHAARDKISKKDGWTRNLTAFGRVVEEGVSTFAECELLGSSLAVNYRHRYHMPLNEHNLLDESLIELLYFNNDNPYIELESEKINDYMQGTEGLRHWGYKIGHYIVSAIADMEEYSLADILRLPTEAYREFAETSL